MKIAWDIDTMMGNPSVLQIIRSAGFGFDKPSAKNHLICSLLLLQTFGIPEVPPVLEMIGIPRASRF